MSSHKSIIELNHIFAGLAQVLSEIFDFKIKKRM